MGHRAANVGHAGGTCCRSARPTRRYFVRASAETPSPQKPLQGEPKVSIVDKTIDILNTRTAPLVGSAGLLVLGVAAVQTVQRLVKLKRESELTRLSSSGGASTFSPSSDTDVASAQPILFSELEAKLMSPLLLAAETSAEVDETSLMSIAELEDLEVTLRTLLSGMDAQLEELKYDVLEQGVIPEEVLEAMDSMNTDDVVDVVDVVDAKDVNSESDELDGSATSDAWREFQLFQGYISDQERRSFRSLLYNRSVQLKLLDQVERQIKIKIATDDIAVDEIAGDTSTDSFDHPLASGQLFYGSGATAPHALKKSKGGEDSFFVDSVAMTMGVADGVGGWERLGIDPGAYSRELMAQCEAIGAVGNASCMQILTKAFQKTAIEGSCTCILAKYLALEGRLDVVSVGDCSMRVVRGGEVVYKTEVQEHAWNQPYQLSHPEFNDADTPDDALEFSFQVMPGDIVVLGSDGLWDNMWDADLLQAVAASDAMRQSYDGSGQWQKEAQELAQRLLELAEAHSLDEAYASPFAQERDAIRRRSEPLLIRLISGMGTSAATARGGKQDDITVVCAIIG